MLADQRADPQRGPGATPLPTRLAAHGRDSRFGWLHFKRDPFSVVAHRRTAQMTGGCRVT
jgi:hypothetical protein